MEKKKTTDEEHDLLYYLGGRQLNKKTYLSLNGKRSGSRKKEHL